MNLGALILGFRVSGLGLKGCCAHGIVVTAGITSLTVST